MKIDNYKAEYAADFKALNIEWLENFFWVEPHDEEVLGDPQKYIIGPGGHIFFILDEKEVIGTVALMKMEEGVFELTKMAISPKARGKKLGQKLMAHTISFAKQMGYKKLIIYSNRKLENAIHIYRKYGFEEIPIGAGNPYSRGDIKMQLLLS